MVPGAAGGAGKAAGGALAGFDALMNAVFAAADGLLQAGATPPGAGSALAAPVTAGQPLPGQGIAGQGIAGQALTDPTPTGQAGSHVADTAAALLVATEQDAGAQPTDAQAVPGAAGAPKLHVQTGKPAGGEASKRRGQADAADVDLAQTPKTVPTAPAAAAEATAAIDAAAIIGEASAKTDDAAEIPSAAATLTPTQMAAAMALMTLTPAPSAAATKPAAPPPGGSSPTPQTGEVPPLPLVADPAAAVPTAAQSATEPKLDLPRDKPADGSAPAVASASIPGPKAEPARAASPPLADNQPPAPPVDPAAAPVTAQAAAASPPPATTAAAEKSAKATRAPREEATPGAAASTPTVRPGPAATVDAAAQNDANKDSGRGSADTAEPQTAAAPAQSTDPQLVADPTAQQPAASASTPAHAAAAAARATPETVANLAGQIVKKLGGRSTQFDLQLDPAGLGKVNVRIEINADGRVSAAMSFDTPQAAAELRARANELQRALAQSGFDVSGGLSFDVTQDQGRGSGQQNAFQNNDNSGRQAFRGRAFAAALETAGDAAQAALIDRRATPSGVDVRI
jgi:hypothetical protein